MPVLLVRHAKAGSRGDWGGPDEQRPLSKAGWRQARGLVGLVHPYEVASILSSPFLRCLQTVEPLAAARLVPVAEEATLGEGMARPALDLVRALADRPVVLCTHGDVVAEVLQHLVAEDGLDLGPGPRWQKGSAWVLQGSGGRFTAATYLAPWH